MKTTDFLDAIKARHNLPSDYAAAALIGVSRQRLSNWRRLREVPDSYSGARFAELLAMDPFAVITSLEIERAERANQSERAEAWRGLIQRMGGVAAAIMLGTVLTSPTPSQAAPILASADSHCILCKLTTECNHRDL